MNAGKYLSVGKREAFVRGEAPDSGGGLWPINEGRKFTVGEQYDPLANAAKGLALACRKTMDILRTRALVIRRGEEDLP